MRTTNRSPKALTAFIICVVVAAATYGVYERWQQETDDLDCALNLATACVNPETGHIHIPSGDAANTMEAFFSLYDHLHGPYPHAGFIYDPDDVAGHQTQEVNGRLSAHETLDRMLVGSGLVITGNPRFIGVHLAEDVKPVEARGSGR